MITNPGGQADAPLDATTPGVATVSVVATLDIPTPGPWRLDVVVGTATTKLAGSVDLTALDPGDDDPHRRARARIATPTLDDVAGDARAVTTDPAPDLRLSRRSTAQALASHGRSSWSWIRRASRSHPRADAL